MHSERWLESIFTCRCKEWITGRVSTGIIGGEFQRFGYFPGRELSPDPPLLLLVAPALHIHPATDTLLRYISPEIDWTLMGIDERWRDGVRVIFRKHADRQSEGRSQGLPAMKRLLLLPSAQKSAQSDQLPEMVCVMVGDQQGLAQDGLAIAPGNWCIEVGSGISYQVVYRLEVFSKRLNAVVPCGCVGRRLCFRPVALRPRWRYVLAITAELENVPLCDAHMLEQHPCRVRKSVYLLASQIGRKINDRIVKSSMRFAAFDQDEQMFS